ncbi:MAG: hypothetical protein AABX73_01550 [Nanoarchaeota archaeon]
MQKKGQAAMEFLMTYGWAILAAVIAIGVLAYFGVFSPGKYVSGSAVVTPPFYMNAWNVQADTGAGSSGAILELQNNGGEVYTVTGINIDGTAPDIDCTTGVITTGISVGTAQAFTVGCASALTTGNNYKGDITITYTKPSSTVVLTSTGTIAEKITA